MRWWKIPIAPFAMLLCIVIASHGVVGYGLTEERLGALNPLVDSISSWLLS